VVSQKTALAAAKRKIITDLINREGGYVDNSSDSGGQTRWGITARTARRNGYRDEIADLPYEKAYEIYELEYWGAIFGDAILNIDFFICEKLFDFGVHSGPARSAEALQRSLNVLNRRGKIYKDVIVDGKIGPKTCHALKAFKACRDIGVLIKCFSCLQGFHYIRTAEKREKDEEFIYGWLKKRIEF